MKLLARLFEHRDVEEDALREAMFSAFDRHWAALGTEEEESAWAALCAAEERFQEYTSNPPKQVVVRVEPID